MFIEQSEENETLLYNKPKRQKLPKLEGNGERLDLKKITGKEIFWNTACNLCAIAWHARDFCLSDNSK